MRRGGGRADGRVNAGTRPDRSPAVRRHPAGAYADCVQIDVFTLFPHWFDWFRGQRHVANALALGTRLECVDYRAHTPLKAGQVDDTPFGGGAGMVLRVDVVEAALRGRYGEDPVELRRRRRVIALPSCEALEVGHRLIPLVRDAIRSIDLEARRIDVDLAFLGE